MNICTSCYYCPTLQVCHMPQEVRDRVGSLLLRLTLKELFEWRFMQVRGVALAPSYSPV